MEFNLTAGIFHPFARIKLLLFNYMNVLKMKKHEKCVDLKHNCFQQWLVQM